jgi:hypothetical protein
VSNATPFKAIASDFSGKVKNSSAESYLTNSIVVSESTLRSLLSYEPGGEESEIKREDALKANNETLQAILRDFMSKDQKYQQQDGKANDKAITTAINSVIGGAKGRATKKGATGETQ